MKHLLLFAVVMAMATTVFAAPQSCGEFPAPTDPCSIGDKIFSGFASTGGVGAAKVTLTEFIPNSEYVIDFQGVFTTDLTISYDVTVDTSVCPSCRISSVGYGLVGLPRVQLATLTVTAGATTGPPTTGATDFVDVIPPTIGPLHIVNDFKANGKSASTISNTIIQDTVPEPLTLGLTGFGLAAMAVFARRRFSR